MDERKDEIEQQPSLLFAILGGSASCLVGAVIWAIITVATETQVGIIALGLGFTTGFAVLYFGQGATLSFRIIGAFLSFSSCLLGNLFAQIGFVALENQDSIFRTIAIVDYAFLFKWIFQNTDPMDILFYAIAAYEGYKFSVKKSDENKGADGLSSIGYTNIKSYPLKKQIFIFTFYIIVGIIGVYSISTGNSFKTYYYPSGEKQYAGKEKNGLLDGFWTYWYENGELMAEINYDLGFEKGPMKYFYEDGSIFSESNYIKAMMHDKYIEYNSDGRIKIEGSYSYDRMIGVWNYYYEDGSVFQTGKYHLDLPDGKWQTYYENGQLMEQGEYQNGTKIGIWNYYSESGEKTLEEKYQKNKEVQILNLWDLEHNQLVKNGNGIYEQYHENGQLSFKVDIKNNSMHGNGIQWYDDGKLLSITEYLNGEVKLIDYWLRDGNQSVIGGEGRIQLHYDNGQLNFDIGYKNGKQSGAFISYYEDGSIAVSCNYLNGELHGDYIQYNESGMKIVQGEYLRGKRNKLWEWWDESDGTLSSKVTFLDNEKEGVQEFWIYNEKVKEEIYIHGKLKEIIPYL